MDRVEAEEAPRVPALVVKPEERHVLVLIMLIAGTLGGRVDLDTRPGEGTRVTIDVPEVAEPAGTPARLHEEASAA